MSEHAALAQLLADPDPGIANALRKQLAEREADPPGLRDAIESLADAGDRARARAARVEAGRERAAAKLVRLAETPDDPGTPGGSSALLEEGALEIARLEDPDVDCAAAVRALDDLARRAREAVAVDAARAHQLANPPRTLAEQRLLALSRFLGETEGFEGDRDEQSLPRSSSLPEVLVTRRGLPIALSVVYLLVARRIDVELHGVGAPLHFLVGAPVGTRHLYVDPFARGRPLETDGVAALLRRMGVVFRPEHLAATGPRAILARMARNLVSFHARRPRGETRARRCARVAVAFEPGT